MQLAPDLAELYRREVARLGDSPTADEAGEDRALIRGLVERVTVTPGIGSDYSVELEGDIIAMIGLGQSAESGRKPKFSAADHASFACSVKVVAGIGFEPMTFRL